MTIIIQTTTSKSRVGFRRRVSTFPSRVLLLLGLIPYQHRCQIKYSVTRIFGPKWNAGSPTLSLRVLDTTILQKQTTIIYLALLSTATWNSIEVPLLLGYVLQRCGIFSKRRYICILLNVPAISRVDKDLTRLRWVRCKLIQNIIQAWLFPLRKPIAFGRFLWSWYNNLYTLYKRTQRFHSSNWLQPVTYMYITYSQILTKKTVPNSAGLLKNLGRLNNILHNLTGNYDKRTIIIVWASW